MILQVVWLKRPGLQLEITKQQELTAPDRWLVDDAETSWGSSHLVDIRFISIPLD